MGAGAGVGSGAAVTAGAGSGVRVVISYSRESSDVPLEAKADCGSGVAVGSSIASSGIAVGSGIAVNSIIAVGSGIIIGVDLGMMSGSDSIIASGVGCIIPAGAAVGVDSEGSIKALDSDSDAAGESDACSPSPPPPSNNPVTLPATITVKATTAMAVETRIAHSNTGLSGGGVGAVTAAGAILNERGASTSGNRRSICTVALSDSISSVHESQPCKCASSAIRSASGSSPSK